MKTDDKVIGWLLQYENPPVRYLTLTKLLKKSETSSLVQQAQACLMDYKVTQGILQHSRQFWKDDDKAYWKYTGKYWQLIFLGQFMANGSDQRIAKGVVDILHKRKWIIKTGGQCLTANLLAAFRRLGYGDHPLIIEETETLAKRIVADHGIKCNVMDYSLLPLCYMAMPKLLHLFAEIPAKNRSESVNSAIKIIVKKLLENEIYVYVSSNRNKWQKILENAPKRSELPKGQTVKEWISGQKTAFLGTHGLGAREAKQGWLKFGFPLHYNSDLLETMYALALLETPMNTKLKKPLEIIKNKMQHQGVWLLENSLNGKMWADVEEKGKSSKWITFFALYVLNHFGYDS